MEKACCLSALLEYRQPFHKEGGEGIFGVHGLIFAFNFLFISFKHQLVFPSANLNNLWWSLCHLQVFTGIMLTFLMTQRLEGCASLSSFQSDSVVLGIFS